MKDGSKRCAWANAGPEEAAYHDTRWCRPEHDENELFAMLCLEGKQAGLSWSLILRREKQLRDAFDGFDPQRVAAYDEGKQAALLRNPEVIRNRAKVRAAVGNAAAFLRVQQEFGSFDRYIWSFTNGETIVHHLSEGEPLPASSELSEEISRDLKRRGFRFVGPVIIYSYLQAIGVINDHYDTCPWK